MINSNTVHYTPHLRTIFYVLIFLFSINGVAQNENYQYTLSFKGPAKNSYQVKLKINKVKETSLTLKMPSWMPGYYQLMNYADQLQNMSVKDMKGNKIDFKKTKNNTWVLQNTKNKSLVLEYEIITQRKFVATSYVDASHAYIVNTNTFLYPDKQIQSPVSVKIIPNTAWKNVTTGLEKIEGKSNEFIAPNFDILYDSPFLIGNLRELPSFEVKGVKHRFIGYDMGTFNETDFIKKVKAIVESASNIIGDIPYKEYTFIAIGPGRGGIEHLNNTTISFNGDGLNNPKGMNTMLNFLAHEYFHHYNVKRIRPFELGPFDYDKGSKTNLLWVSEGLSVYYEYLTVTRAGLKDEATLLANIEANINTHENNPGRLHQSLTQASFKTWKDGPFGASGDDKNKSISYYEKGPIIGMLLDFSIREASQNKKSLDDVMRYLYWHYYKELGRGFTDAEFEEACETIAGKSLTEVFEYVYTTKSIDYNSILGAAGLEINMTNLNRKTKKFKIKKLEKATKLQTEILQSWLGK
ncbi:peptidase M61 [Polaribacter pacificus]|uniref:Peptidase M61 n=1 Tax=Polaribacter pacificus TaxID=1775173 RepID=A0A917I143_9FLAO|nr:M61 family metallopeptidase [Polaribacter pacificus]GGH00448.1 peptidase M61 [Polaribacter pacificus]